MTKRLEGCPYIRAQIRRMERGETAAQEKRRILAQIRRMKKKQEAAEQAERERIEAARLAAAEREASIRRGLRRGAAPEDRAAAAVWLESKRGAAERAQARITAGNYTSRDVHTASEFYDLMIKLLAPGKRKPRR
jgi:hypothetical protein